MMPAGCWHNLDCDWSGAGVNAGSDVDAIAPEVDGKFMSAFVRARRP